MITARAACSRSPAAHGHGGRGGNPEKTIDRDVHDGHDERRKAKIICMKRFSSCTLCSSWLEGFSPPAVVDSVFSPEVNADETL
jgi:hypothetical protein